VTDEEHYLFVALKWLLLDPLTKDLNRRMSSKDWSDWRRALSLSGVEVVIVRYMWNKTPESIFQITLHKASDVLHNM